MNKRLSFLLKDIVEIKAEDDDDITGITSDSREVNPGDLFIAYPGDTHDGREYIRVAAEQGATAIVAEAKDYQPTAISTPVILVENLQQKIGTIAANFYDNPSKKMQVIGITGTNGKTSCSNFIANALGKLEISCGIIGTLGYGFPGKLEYGEYTTPDAITVQKQLFNLYKEGAKAVAMEVSSHALEQYRVSGIDFNIAAFTNLSRDHLDYHGSMFNYGMAKKKLFEIGSVKHAIINIEDDFGYEILEEVARNKNVIGYSTNGRDLNYPCVRASHIKPQQQGFISEVATPWGEGVMHTDLLGRFNISNLLVVMAVLGAMDIELSQILKIIPKLKTVIGRMQAFGGGDKPLVVVDFAHTPDALEKALIGLREHCKGTLWCVFGCGGDRDRGKRPIMGQVAEQYSDHIIITDDNPRTEESQQIIDEIVQGLVCPWAAEIEPDRGAAIAHAIDCAAKGDIILVAGKGHEPYQIIGHEKIPFSDIEQIKSLL